MSITSLIINKETISRRKRRGYVYDPIITFDFLGYPVIAEIRGFSEIYDFYASNYPEYDFTFDKPGVNFVRLREETIVIDID